MNKYQTPELKVTSCVLSKDIAVNLGSNVWDDFDEVDENGNPIE